jgi:two-component system chemotaxis response regulator CheB
MPGLLSSLAHEPAGQTKSLPRSMQYEVEIARTGRGSMEEMDQFGRRSVLACPDCGGVMWEIDEGELSRFRCHVGHTYTSELMSLALDENLRRALASALRALEERVALAQKLYNQAKTSGHRLLAENWTAKLNEFQTEMDIIRGSIRRMDRLAAQADMERKSAAE